MTKGNGCTMANSIGVMVADKNKLITHVNDGFNAITGYSWQESLGKNPHFLQGTDTNKDAITTLRSAMSTKKPCRVRILNYHKSGRKYWCVLTVFPCMDQTGQLNSFVGVQVLQQYATMGRNMPSFNWTNLDRQVPPSKKPSHKCIELVDEDTFTTATIDQMENEDAERMPPTKVQFVAETLLPTKKGKFRVLAYVDKSKPGNESEIMVLIHGKVESRANVICRVHDQCYTSEVIHSLKCDCREQLDYAMDFIKDSERCPEGGMVIYMPQEGRGIGLVNKIKAYSMQELGLDTVDANRVLGFEDDYRDYRAVGDILRHLQVSSLQLMTNNPRKIEQLELHGVKIAGRIPVVMDTNQHSDNYVNTKGARMGHMIGNVH